jgi:twinkle protein
MATFQDLGINLGGKDYGQAKTKCPQCSDSRQKNRHDKPLSVNVSDGVFHCHHCGWKGSTKEATGRNGYPNMKPKAYTKPAYKISTEAVPNKLLEWFKARGIGPDVVGRNRISRCEVWMPQTEKTEPAIAFPYYRNDEVVNVKYRTAEKHFRMEKGAELVLYGIDDITPGAPLYFVEGEIDKLSFEEAGIRNCVSVPNGAKTNLDVLASAESLLVKCSRFVIAVDNDEPGRALEAELIRRLGPEKCYRVTWHEGCKDANEVLMSYGVDGLLECLKDAAPVPIEGAFEVRDIMPDLIELYENGRPRGEYPGWDNLAELYRPRLGDWTVITGSPGSGKSSFLAALMVNLAIRSGWSFAVYPPENMPPQEYVSLLMEIYSGQPFNFGPQPRMSRETMLEAAEWVQDHFIILNPVEGQRDLDGLLSLAKSFVFRRGIKGFVIDPWNELEHFQPGNQTETQYIGQSLIKLRHFARNYQVHVWVVAHPAKLQKIDGNTYPVATLYDIAGSAHWFNKADMGISVWRDKSDDMKPVEVHIQKVRFRWCGHLGMASLYYDKVTGQYFEQPVVNELGQRQPFGGTDEYKRVD